MKWSAIRIILCRNPAIILRCWVIEKTFNVIMKSIEKKRKPRIKKLNALSHAAISHGSACFSKFALPERLAILCTLVRDETDDNESNNGDTSEYTETNRKN